MHLVLEEASHLVSLLIITGTLRWWVPPLEAEEPRARGGCVVTATNAPNIDELEGSYVQGGGSYGEGMIVGGDVSLFGSEGGNIYMGLTLSAGIGGNIPVPGEIHGEVGKTKIFYRVNVFDVIQSYFDEIMER